MDGSLGGPRAEGAHRPGDLSPPPSQKGRHLPPPCPVPAIRERVLGTVKQKEDGWRHRAVVYFTTLSKGRAAGEKTRERDMMEDALVPESYRKQLSSVLLRRSLTSAAQRAAGAKNV